MTERLAGWKKEERRMCITFVFMERKSSYSRREAMGLVKRSGLYFRG